MHNDLLEFVLIFNNPQVSQDGSFEVPTGLS